MKQPICEKCGKSNPSQEYREASEEAAHAMAKYTGMYVLNEEEWCDCCAKCGGSWTEYKCVCVCEHGLRLYDNCVPCDQWECPHGLSTLGACEKCLREDLEFAGH